MNIVCIKAGSRYKAEYVNRLYSMVARQASFPFKFFCYTEKPDGIRPEVLTRPLYYAFDPAWWNKLWLFKPLPELADDYILALDLDIVITASLDFLSFYKGSFCGLRDWSQPEKYNGSMWLLKPGYRTDVWEDFIEDADAIMHRLYSDQEWLTEKIPVADDFEQIAPGKILSFRQHFWQKQEWQKGGAIYSFHGLPKPHEVVGRVPWIKENWR
jgi:hypothetical protein